MLGNFNVGVENLQPLQAIAQGRLIKLIPLRKGGVRGLCFSRGYFTTP